MANPNSFITLLRQVIARKIDPCPDPGEAWCIGCSLNEGATKVINADGIREHSRIHQNTPGYENLSVSANWPSGKETK